MENVITLNLEDYQKLLEENIRLKMIIEQTKKRVFKRIDSNIYTGQIEELTIEECRKIINKNPTAPYLSMLIDKYSSYAESYWRRLAEEDSVNEDELVFEVGMRILKYIMKRYESLKVKEVGDNHGED